MKLTNIIKLIQNNLSDDLRKKPWKGMKNKVAGHCYIVCEALYHFTNKELKPQHIKVNNMSHWFLKDKLGKIIDPTAKQFDFKVNYENGRGKGFLTTYPSKRCRELLKRCNLDIK